MNPSGSIIFPRDVISELQSKPELLALMTVLVARARFKATESERGQSLKPGQALAGKRELSRLFGWSESRAYRALKRLQGLDLIELTSDRRGSVVTVSDWSRYSSLPKRKRTNSETMSNTNQGRRHEKKKSLLLARCREKIITGSQAYLRRLEEDGGGNF